MPEVFILVEHGDDYHGSRTVKAFRSRRGAEDARRELAARALPCDDCGHVFSHSVHALELGD